MIRVPIAWLEWFDLRRSLVWIVLLGGGYGFFVWRAYHAGSSPFGLLAWAPVVGVLLAPAITALVPGVDEWIRERTWKPWQGIYYAFDDHQIRVVEARGVLWFSSEDVHAALTMKRRDAVIGPMNASERRIDPEAGEMLSNAGLARLLGVSTERRTLRLLTWADQVRRVWQKKRDMQGNGSGPSAVAQSTAKPASPIPPTV